MVGLVLSNVVDDPPEISASVPTVLPSPEEEGRVLWLFEKHGPGEGEGGAFALPPAVLELLQREAGEAAERPVFVATAPAWAIIDTMGIQPAPRCVTLRTGNNALSLRAAAIKATAVGYCPVVLGDSVQGGLFRGLCLCGSGASAPNKGETQHGAPSRLSPDGGGHCDAAPPP